MKWGSNLCDCPDSIILSYLHHRFKKITMKKYTVDYLMKTRPHLKKILVILGSLLILIAFSGCTLNGGNVSQTTRATITQSIQNASEIDAWCEIQEFNLTIVQNQTAVPVTDEDTQSVS